MLMYAGQIWKRILLNYICLLYAIIYPYFYEKLHKVSLRTFDMKWQYYSLVLLFILAFCMVILAKQELSFASISNPIVFLVLLYFRYRVIFILNRIDFIFLSVLFVIMLFECIKVWKRRRMNEIEKLF